MELTAEVVRRVGEIALALPEAYEQDAWTGVRWRIRQRTFAHVLAFDPERQRAYGRAFVTDEPATVMTFRSTGAELRSLLEHGYPFVKPDWSPTVVGMVLDERTDWEEVTELLTESYRFLAPKKLQARLGDR